MAMKPELRVVFDMFTNRAQQNKAAFNAALGAQFSRMRRQTVLGIVQPLFGARQQGYLEKLLTAIENMYDSMQPVICHIDLTQ